MVVGWDASSAKKRGLSKREKGKVVRGEVAKGGAERRQSK